MSDIARQLARWIDAGLIDRDTAARLEAFEAGRARERRAGWAPRIALGLGAIVIVAGVFVFVAANWDWLSPSSRVALALAIVAITHGVAALSAVRSALVAEVLHGIGTALFGAAIFLVGQVFNLEIYWALGVLLWAVGAVVAWGILRDTVHLVYTAVLVPAWIGSEWVVVADAAGDEARVARLLGVGSVLLALAYLAAQTPASSRRRRVLHWVGAALLLPAALVLAAGVGGRFRPPDQSLSLLVLSAAWTIAVGGPVVVAAELAGARAWPIGVAAAWVVILCGLPVGTLWPHAWWALGSAALAAWGVRDADTHRINLGFVLFAATVTVFYFSRVMTAMAQSASLIGLGVLLVAGGWALDRARRRVVALSTSKDVLR